MAKIAAIIQARMGSTRLPGKVLKKIKDKSILQHVIDRVSTVKNLDEIIIATTKNQRDNAIIDEAVRLGVKYYRGDEEDVLGRHYYAAKDNSIDIIVRITSDCPVIDPIIIEQMINKFMTLNKIQTVDYMNNTLEATFPRGMDTEIFTFKSLEKAFIEAKNNYEREHVTPYIYLNPDKFNIIVFKNSSDFSKYRLTLDTPQDLQVIENIYDKLYKKSEIFYLNDIIDVLKKYPEIAKNNENIKQKKLDK